MKEKRLKKSWFPIFLLCVSLFFCSCGVNGESQFTTINEKYLQAENATSALEDVKEASTKVEETDKPKKEGKEKKSDHNIEKKTSVSKKQQDKKKKMFVKKTDKKSEKKTKSDKKKKSVQKRTDTTLEEEKTEPSKSSEPEEKYCTVSIDCQTILSNLSDLNEVKKEFVPSDGWILKPLKVTLHEGDTAYDILYKVCREKKIHMEAAYTPAYGTYYVEGIHQLYEFDCGDLSGWTYLVNGLSLNYGASNYKVQSGDEICWRFSCNAGKDVR